MTLALTKVPAEANRAIFDILWDGSQNEVYSLSCSAHPYGHLASIHEMPSGFHNIYLTSQSSGDDPQLVADIRSESSVDNAAQAFIRAVSRIVDAGSNSERCVASLIQELPHDDRTSWIHGVDMSSYDKKMTRIGSDIHKIQWDDESGLAGLHMQETIPDSVTGHSQRRKSVPNWINWIKKK